MKEELRRLVADTLLYAKDPLQNRGSLFITNEEALSLRPKNPLPPPQEAPSPPSKPPPLLQKKTTPLPPPVYPAKKEEPAPIHIKETLLKLAPQLRLVDPIPDDKEGRRLAHAWKEKVSDAEVLLLACTQEKETVEFLKSLAKAINERLAKAKIFPVERLEKEKQWDLLLNHNPFRLIIASEGLHELQDLMRFYHLRSSQYFLSQIPLLSLLPASSYKHIEKKAHLWKTLCQLLSK